eukprot:tig00021493_g21877.t1
MSAAGAQRQRWRKRRANPGAYEATADYSGLVEQNARGWLVDGCVLVRDEPGAKLIHRNGIFGQLPGSDRLTNTALLRRRPEHAQEGERPAPDLRIQLALDEAYFLVARVGCLRVIHNDKQLSVRECWRVFCEEDPRFPWLYRVYEHLREKGWVLKGGLRFGAEYVLYRDNPELCHSEYTVVVVRHPSRKRRLSDPAADAGAGEESASCSGAACEGACDAQAAEACGEEQAGFPVRWKLDVAEGMSWTELQRLSRLSGHVSKELVAAHVYEGAALPGAPGDGGRAWLDAAEVREVLVQRWVPEQSRE